MMTPRKKSIAKKVAAGMIAVTLSASAFPLVRPNASKQLAIRTGDYGGVLNTLAISNNAKTNLRRAVNQLASINPVVAVGAEIAQIDDPVLARKYADSLYRYADDIQTEFAINARNVVEKAQKKLANACETPSLASYIIHGDCGDVQAKAVRNFINFKKQFVKRTRKETLSNIRNQIEFIALAPKVSLITNAEAEKIATRFLRERRITADGRMSVYSEDVAKATSYLAGAVNYYMKVLLAIMAMASFISWKLAEIFKQDAIEEITSKKPPSPPKKKTPPPPPPPPAAPKKKTPPPPPPPPAAPKKKTPSPPKKKTPSPSSRNNLFTQIRIGSALRKTSAPKKKTPPPSSRNNLFTQIRIGSALRKTPKPRGNTAPTSAVNPVLAAALAKRRTAMSPSNGSPN